MARRSLNKESEEFLLASYDEYIATERLKRMVRGIGNVPCSTCSQTENV